MEAPPTLAPAGDPPPLKRIGQTVAYSSGKCNLYLQMTVPSEKLLFSRGRTAYASRTASHALVKEILALRGVEAARAEAIAGNAGVKLHWVDSLPAPNGESAVLKLENERDILVLRNRTSPTWSNLQWLPLGNIVRHAC